MNFLATIEKYGHAFHFFIGEDKKLYYTVNDFQAEKRGGLEYDEVHKIIRSKDGFFNQKTQKKTLIKGKKVLGVYVEEFAIHKIISTALNDEALPKGYNYQNYVNFKNQIKDKKGIFVRVCNDCKTPLIISNINGSFIGKYSLFDKARKELLSLKEKNLVFCYGISEHHYFIKSKVQEKFRCRTCVKNLIYRLH